MTATFEARQGAPGVPQWCNLTVYGSGYGKHQLCNVAHYIKPEGACTFWSFGIEKDASFDTDLISRHDCYGLGLDPSVSYQTNFLGANAVFLQVGARLKESPPFVPKPGVWFLASVPALAKALSIEKLQVLKMDCEGCEYGLADDVLKHDERFFHKVDQIAIEIHTTKLIAQTKDHALALGRLFYLLEDAGLVLVDFDLSSCGGTHNIAGQQEEFTIVGYPDKNEQNCQNLLFAKHTGVNSHHWE